MYCNLQRSGLRDRQTELCGKSFDWLLGENLQPHMWCRPDDLSNSELSGKDNPLDLDTQSNRGKASGKPPETRQPSRSHSTVSKP